MDQRTTGPTGSTSSTKLVIVALVMAVLAVVMTNLLIASARKTAQEQSFTVYLLNRSVRPGDTIKEGQLRTVTVPLRFKDSFARLGALDATAKENKITTREKFNRYAPENELLTFSLFLAPTGSHLDQKMTVGMRAVALPINSRTVPGPLREGMYVDIEGAFNVGGGIIEVLPVMEKVKIYALGARSVYGAQPDGRRASRNYRTITIEVSPDQATLVEMVKRIVIGDFELHLRNPRDSQLVKIPDGGINPAVLELIDRRIGTPQVRKRR